MSTTAIHTPTTHRFHDPVKQYRLYQTSQDSNGLMQGVEPFDTGAEVTSMEAPAPLHSTVLLMAVGPIATSIMQETAIIQESWLPYSEPLHQIQLELNEPDDQQLFELSRQLQAACTELANQQQMHLQAPETTVDNRKPASVAQAWLLLDLTIHDDQSAEETVNLDERYIDKTGALLNERIARANQLLERFAGVACRTLPKAIVPQLLLICDPAQPALRERCRRQLYALAADTVYLVGAQLSKMREETWQRRAATALAAQLWLQRTAPASNSPFVAIGASAQPWPTQPLIRTMALLSTQRAIQPHLMETANAASDVVANGKERVTPTDPLSSEILIQDGQRQSAAMPTPLHTLITTLLTDGDQAIPPLRPTPLHRTQPRWWRDATHPIQALLTHHQIAQQKRHAMIRTARHTWLSTQLGRWNSEWQAFCGGSAPNSPGRPNALPPISHVKQLQQALLATAQQIDEELAQLASHTEQTTATVQNAGARLKTLSQGVPTLSLDGMVQICTRPTAWPRWLWQRIIQLPQQLRQFGRLVAKEEAALYAEANYHLRRQLALAMLQDIQQQLLWQQEVHGHLTALTAYLDEALTKSMQQLPMPWQRVQVEQLRQNILQKNLTTQAEGTAMVTTLLHSDAAEEWIDGSIESIGESLVDAYAMVFEELHLWTSRQWLQAMFPASEPQHKEMRKQADRTVDTALFAWLDASLADASVLWPVEESTSPDPVVGTLAMPALAANRESVPVHIPMAYHPAVQGWLAHHPEIQLINPPIQAIVLRSEVAIF